jgi:conjugative transfer signal peptidase TraF
LKAGVVAAVLAAGLIASILSPPPLLLVWNATASTRIGLYVVTQVAPRRRDLLLIRLPPEVELFAISRGMLAPRIPILKPVVALAGDRVCRLGSTVSVNDRFAAVARYHDRQGRSMPAWRWCRRLTDSQAFLLARHPDSFDSRYFGPIDVGRSKGVAHPLITLAAP